ncbi:sn-glycerol-3-phosphate import ATP-binding protein ugpC [Vibrio nigripulchritudo SFn27]|uniref:sn-glycerol-3-phosphate import ATP-binding protein ugpC n=1 Tax=Vibrio nigripulchritudo TaxID=28173 RepID=U4KGC2_9VIBR|nr:sn-glycerol-3-phosphate ABC transporter ATP-binding protein UgpC [Vibrio nigripulchritudo]KJY73724.1 sugar ABC transporter ATPase [Vibrio nigripulchritudo]CCN82468.1 sn-glycerol-3-phosphate import ATP-binding protein ugpC [Vibrio nigripulchritudo BLFn1]CCN91455.1 sn-glycerol-3-phosphate import ATP-binding protein ugpC [Vibrio nigripulchritudo SFn27]CCN97619.1 sn-glycerol-3-phosphate import ATP-binding protein ugpC [Vibrio nigripulchritudo ENn2]CCO38762.1 sn-glycerol-3-phosphate import ATP-b
MTSVTLTNITKSYGETEIVHGIDLNIEPGEFVVLLGPSGCGKTTTLRMIAGLEDVTSGDLCIGDSRVNDVPPKDRGIAMVFQNYALYPHMTVRENMAFALKPQKLSQSEVEERIKNVSETLGLDTLLERKPSQLSGGQRQRVAMGRAMVRTPNVFLFDEPLSNLDAKLRSKVRFEIAKLHQTLKSTVVYVTHDQIEAMTLADKIVVMRDGLIEQIGSPESIYRHPANTFVATFIGSPEMNLLDAQLQQNGAENQVLFNGASFPLSAIKLAKAPTDSNIVLGVRPDHLLLSHQAFKDVPSLEAKVTLIEYLGQEKLINLTVGDVDMCALVSSTTSFSEGQSLFVSFDMSQVSIFDKATQENLLPNGGSSSAKRSAA